ncbi:MAG: type II secretion system protein [Candidatus Omnitrophota bacterium]
MKNKKGFTLIELMVVMVVISILIGIAIPRFKGMQDQANVSKAQMELRTVQAAIESFYVNQVPKEYPNTSDSVIADQLLDATPKIVNEILYDPFLPQQEYNYILSDDEQFYVIFSAGVNRVYDITGIEDETGQLLGDQADDPFVTNGLGW